MPSKLSDAQVAELRELAAKGVSGADLAERFQVSRRHVGRLLRGEQRQQLAGLDRDLARGSVVLAVEHYLDGLELDASGQVLAEAATVLAAKLDTARVSDTAAAATAAPALAKQLVDVVAALRPDGAEPDALDDLQRRRAARLLALSESRNGGSAA